MRLTGEVLPIIDPTREGADCLRFRDIVLDRSAHSVTRRGRELRLSAIEFRLLAFFLDNVGRVLSREELLASVWGTPGSLHSRTVDVHVGRLRKALRYYGGREVIRTVKGSGYALGDSTECVALVPSAVTRPAPAAAAGSSSNRAPCPSGIEIDPIAGQAFRFGRLLKLSPKEFALLELLVSNRGKLLTREQIAGALGGNIGTGRVVDKTVERLRKAVNLSALPDPIRSVVGAGYKFSPESESHPSPTPPYRRRRHRLKIPPLPTDP